VTAPDDDKRRRIAAAVAALSPEAIAAVNSGGAYARSLAARKEEP
jgi:hypothetical protein